MTQNFKHEDFIPVGEIIGKYCSRKTFYVHVHNGLIRLYKLGNKSFVKGEEFFNAFAPVDIIASGLGHASEKKNQQK